jgi:gamma-glutamylaminecyclotransferase
MTLLFVYGTLRRGERNHRLLADQQFVADAETEPAYRKLDLGSHPGLVAGTDVVPGELWRVNDCCLAELDEFEEVPTLFDRRPVRVVGWAGAEAYFWVR